MHRNSMSQLGQKATSQCDGVTCACPPATDIAQGVPPVRFVAFADFGNDRQTRKTGVKKAAKGTRFMKTPSDQKANWRARIAFFFLFVFMIALSIGAYFIARLQERVAAQESQTALQDITDPKQIDEALKRNPSNKILKMITTATNAENETDSAAEALLNEVEPPALSKPINLGTASRSDLEVLRRDLKAAEANATAFMPRYLALVKTQQDKLEIYALSLGAEKDIVGRVFDSRDKRRAKITALYSEMLLARADYYRARERYVAILVGELGAYKVVDGQFMFPLQTTVNRYNAAAHAMTLAAKRVAELDDERRKLLQSKLKAWEQLVDRK